MSTEPCRSGITTGPPSVGAAPGAARTPHAGATPRSEPVEDVLMIVGVSHRNAPIAVREALAFAKDELPQALAVFRKETGIAEAMILSTCNRVEVYGRGPRAALLRAHGRGASRVEPFLYRLTGEDAVRHAFRVASGA